MFIYIYKCVVWLSIYYIIYIKVDLYNSKIKKPTNNLRMIRCERRNKHYTTDTIQCILMRFLARVPVSSSQTTTTKMQKNKK